MAEQKTDFTNPIEHTERMKDEKGQVVGSSKLTKEEMEAVIKNGTTNKVTIDYGDGRVETETYYAQNGVTYRVNSNGTGTKLVDGGDGKGVYKKTDILDMDGGMTPDGYTTYIKLKPDEEEYYEVTQPPKKPEPPKKPSISSFNLPEPKFESNLVKLNKYLYFFGLDKINLTKKQVNKECCFTSQEIVLKNVKDGDFIQLEAVYSIDESSSTEFYIIHNNDEFPILPVETDLIYNEKIFFNRMTRFEIDYSKDIIIKKDGEISNKTVEQAIQSTDGLYTITYSPLLNNNNGYSYLLAAGDHAIKIKTIQRLYDTSFKAPIIKDLKIRKYGGSALWVENI